MLKLFVRYICKPGMRETFVRRVEEAGILAAIRGEEGCLGYDYYFSAQDPRVLLLVEKWQTPAHQEAHMSQPHMNDLRAIKSECVTDTRLGEDAL